MKRFLSFSALAIFLVFAAGSANADNGNRTKYEKKFLQANEILQDALTRNQNSIPPQVLANAKAIAIFPDVMKAGFIAGVSYGEGVVLTRGEDNVWSPPAYFTLKGLSAGLQAGIRATDVILCVMNDRGVEALLKQRLTLGAELTIAAGPGAIEAEGDKDIFLHADIYSYARSRGLFAGVALNGANIGYSANINRVIYGQKLSVDDIIIRRSVVAPQRAEALLATLKTYADQGK